MNGHDDILREHEVDPFVDVDPTAPPVVDPDIFEDERPIDAMPDIKAATIVDITKRAYIIRKMERKRDYLKDISKQTVSFYRNRVESIDRSIDEIKGQIRAYMDYVGVRNIPTTAGTVYRKHLEEIDWDDAAVLEWLKSQGEELYARCTRVKIELDKNMVKAFMKETGTIPDGVSTTAKEKVYVR